MLQKIGKCQTMCPPGEVSPDKRLPSPFECDLNGIFRPELAIKTYERSGAGKEINIDEIRPLPVLMKTMDHIMKFVILKKMNTAPNTTEIQMYFFVRDRLRSIKTDLIYQELKGNEPIQILEKSCLFYIWSGSHFFMDTEQFDFKQNMEQITQTMLSLNELFDDYFIQTNQHHPTESFFRALDLITSLYRPGYMEKILSFPKEILFSNFVQTILKIRKAILMKDFKLFLSILDQAPIPMVSYILQNTSSFWEEIGIDLKITFNKFEFPLTFLTDYLRIPENAFNLWTNYFSIIQSPNPNLLRHDLKSISNSSFPSVIVPDNFYLNPDFSDPIYFMKFDEIIGSLDISHEPPQTIPEEPTIAKKEEAQSVAAQNENLIEQAENPPLTVQKPKVTFEEPVMQPIQEKPSEEKLPDFLNESNTEQNMPSFIPHRPNSASPALLTAKTSHVSINSKSISRRNLIMHNPDLYDEKISIRDIMSMIPYKVPRISYACILLIADDNLPSSVFALNRFIIKSENGSNSPLIFCQKLTNPSETCYISISSNKDQLGVTSILDCNEDSHIDNEAGSNLNAPVIKFDYEFGFSPVLTFNTCLRKAIEIGITEIIAFNLSDFVQNIFSSFVRKVMYTSWQFASANAVLQFFNEGLVCISRRIVDTSFTKFILPFEHREFNFDELVQYSNKIKSMQFDLIDKNLSRSKISGSNWPSYIKDRIKVVLPKFIIPLSAKFNKEEFIDQIMSELPFQEPPETIF